LPGRSLPPVLLVAAAGVVGLALLGTAAFTTGGAVVTDGGEGPAVEVPLPAPGSGPVVFASHTSGPRFSLFGLDFGGQSYVVHVGFVPPPGCSAEDGEHITPGGPCGDIAGEVVGGGTLETGDRLMIVAVDVGRNCFEELEPGDQWPPQRECGP